MEPYEALGNFAQSARPCVRLKGYEKEKNIAVGRVLTWRMNDGMQDSCTMDVRAQLASGYHQVAASLSGDARLYEPNAPK